MTVTAEHPQTTWQVRPGWGIAVDLTPREVLQARKVRVNQQLIGLVLLLVLMLCAGASLLTRADTASAQRDRDQEQARTAQLAADAEQYAPVRAMQTVTAQRRGDLAVVMAPDVDVVDLLAQIRASLPAGLAVTSESVLLTPAPAVVTDPAAAVDSTLPQVVGTVTVSGTGNRIADVTPFVSALNGLRGVVDVLPVSVTQGEAGMEFTISLNVTDQLYTDRFALDGTK